MALQLFRRPGVAKTQQIPQTQVEVQSRYVLSQEHQFKLGKCAETLKKKNPQRIYHNTLSLWLTLGPGRVKTVLTITKINKWRTTAVPNISFLLIDCSSSKKEKEKPKAKATNGAYQE